MTKLGYTILAAYLAFAPLPTAAQIAQDAVTGSSGGSGTVTSVATSCGVTGGTITISGTISGAAQDNPQTGTTYTIQSTDCGLVDRFTNASAVTITVPTPTGFASNFFVTLKCESAGGCSTSGTVDGSASAITIAQGNSIDLYVDGSSAWHKLPGNAAGGGGGTVTTTGSPASGNLAKFSGSTSITSGDLSGDCTTSGTMAVTCNILPHPGYLNGLWYIPFGIAGQTAGAGLTANRISCVYGAVNLPIHIGTVGMQVTTAGASGNVQAALYSNVNSRPGTLISNTASMSTTSIAQINAALGSSVAVGPGTTNGRDIWWCSNQDTAGAGALLTGQSNSNAGPSFGALVGSTTVADAFSNIGSSTGVQCTGAACNGGSSTFGTWPASLAGSTWTDVAGSRTPTVIFQATVP